MHKIKVLQKKAMPVICHTAYNAPATPLFKKHNIMKFEDLFKFQTCQFMFKLHSHNLPIPLDNICTKNLDVHNHRTRQRGDFVIPLYKHNIVHKSFLSFGPRLWSSHPLIIKSCNYKPFCRRMKIYLINNYD